MEYNPSLKEIWNEKHGDRHTKLAFIGTDLDRELIERELNECLLTDAEYYEDWSKMIDPFRWELSKN